MYRIIPLTFATFLVLTGAAAAEETGGPNLTPVYLVLLAVVALMAVLLGYIWGLHNRTSALLSDIGVHDEGRVTLLTSYANLPLGVPRGTVRAVLAMLIVFASLAFLSVSIAGGAQYKFPDALLGILGAVLGFYFGKSGSDEGEAVRAVSAANADAKNAMAQANDATAKLADAQGTAATANRNLDEAKAQNAGLAKDHIDRVTDQLKGALDIGKTLSVLLPGDIGKTVGDAADKLNTTLNTVSDLRHGNLAGAAQQVSGLLDKAAPNLPIVNVLTQAMNMIGPALGGAVPGLALITTVVGIGAKLGTVAYNRWVARVMDAPYTPEQFAPTVFDSNAAETLILQVPEIEQAFARPLQDGGRAEALTIVRLALEQDAAAALTARYPGCFDGMDQGAIDLALSKLRRAALDFVLGDDFKSVPPETTAALGGPAGVLEALDKVNANPQARAGLDVMMTTVATLKQAGQNPAAAIADAAKQIPIGPISAGTAPAEQNPVPQVAS